MGPGGDIKKRKKLEIEIARKWYVERHSQFKGVGGDGGYVGYLDQGFYRYNALGACGETEGVVILHIIAIDIVGSLSYSNCVSGVGLQIATTASAGLVMYEEGCIVAAEGVPCALLILLSDAAIVYIARHGTPFVSVAAISCVHT